jgi:hypothetical protein
MAYAQAYPNSGPAPPICRSGATDATGIGTAVKDPKLPIDLRPLAEDNLLKLHI